MSVCHVSPQKVIADKINRDSLVKRTRHRLLDFERFKPRGRQGDLVGPVVGKIHGDGRKAQPFPVDFHEGARRIGADCHPSAYTPAEAGQCKQKQNPSLILVRKNGHGLGA